MRRGGVQHLAAAGVDVWRIQALARHSSSAILSYLGQSHVKPLANVASEAAAGTSMQPIQDELRALKATVRRLAQSQSAGSSSDTPSDRQPTLQLIQSVIPPEGSVLHVPLDPSILAPEALVLAGNDPWANEGRYVVSNSRAGRVHIRNPAKPGFTLCAWAWAACQSAELQHSPSRAQGLVLHCLRCFSKADRIQEQQSESSADSSSSSSSSSP